MSKIEQFCGESDIERLTATLRGKKTDRVPNFEILIEDKHVEKLLGRKAGNTLGVEGNPAEGSQAAGDIRPMYPEDYIELCQMIGQDAIVVETFYAPIKQRTPDGGVAPLNDRSLKTRSDLDRVIWPDESDIEHRLQYIREYVAAAKDSRIGVIFSGACIWQNLYEFAIGLHDCLIMMIEDPEFFEELMTRVTDWFVELIERALGEGVDVFYPADDIAYNKGLFVAPETFERLWRPHYERILAPALKAGLPIMFHSDGKIDDVMDMLLDMGMDCVTPMDPSGIDYRDYKKRYGRRVTLHGNIDITWPLVGGTPADVEKDVKDHMDVLAPGGRWIAGSSHSVVNYIPHENFVAMINAIHKYGTY